MELTWRIIEEVNVCTCSNSKSATVKRLIRDADCENVLCDVYPSI